MTTNHEGPGSTQRQADSAAVDNTVHGSVTGTVVQAGSIHHVSLIESGTGFTRTVKMLASAPERPVDEQLRLLATASWNQWTAAANDRRLGHPAPLPIRWRRATEAVASPVSAATYPRFDPLPGLTAVSGSGLREGDKNALHRIYGGLPSGRLLLIGPPGSGKSAAAILLLDEIPQSVRPGVLEALADAPFRLILLTRTAEAVAAADHGPLAGVAEHRRPNSALSEVLTTPLALSLLRDVYGPAGAVDELLDSALFPTAADIENHLLDHAITAAYTPRRPADLARRRCGVDMITPVSPVGHAMHRRRSYRLQILHPMLTRRMFMQLMAASTTVAATGSDFLSQVVANAAPARFPRGSKGVEHVVVLMLENRSFDHFLGWLPGADGRQDMTFLSADGNVYPNYPLAPDFQGCGYSDPDHSWEGFLVQHNGGRMDGFLQRPTTAGTFPGVIPAAANTFPVGYYTNFGHDHQRKAVPDLPVIGALAEHYTVLDRYFCSFAGETFPNRFYQHAARTDRDHNSNTISSLPTIWDQLSPIPNTQGVPTGGYFFRDSPFLALWGTKYFPFWHPFADGDTDALGIPVTTPSFIDTVAQGNLPNVSFIDPAFDIEGNGTSGDDHPFGDIRLGERFVADAYHALSDAGYLDNTVFVITFDEWGGFYDHVPPPRVVDDTDPANVDHTGDSTTPTDGRLVPDYGQLGFRVPAIVVSNLAPARVVHQGPFEHASTLKMIESTFGLNPITARDANAEDLGQVLKHTPRRPVPAGTIPASDQVPGPISPAAAICGAEGVQSISPEPVRVGVRPPRKPESGRPTVAGMVAFGREYRKGNTGQ